MAGAPLARPSGISLTSDGLPKFINHELREAIRARDPRSISFALTLLSLSRSILGGKPVDLSAIEDGPTVPEDNYSEVIRNIGPFLNHFKINKFDTSWSGFHWSTKAGPAGPAMVSSLGTWRSLPKSLKDLHILIAGPELSSVYKEYDTWSEGIWSVLLNLYPFRPNGLIRKLSVKKDREAKSRVFAILDYYSQAVLRPIHLGLFQGLKQIPSDRTFVQADGGLNLNPSSSFHSLDLSNATDRFPLKIQQALLAHLIGPEKAQAWADILVNYEYSLEGKPVIYKTGQPMGAYSS